MAAVLGCNNETHILAVSFCVAIIISFENRYSIYILPSFLE